MTRPALALAAALVLSPLAPGAEKPNVVVILAGLAFYLTVGLTHH